MNTKTLTIKAEDLKAAHRVQCGSSSSSISTSASTTTEPTTPVATLTPAELQLLRIKESKNAARLLLILPEEMWLHIASFFDVRQLADHALVCRKWRQMCNKDVIWKQLCERTFNEHTLEFGRPNWKEMYKCIYTTYYVPQFHSGPDYDVSVKILMLGNCKKELNEMGAIVDAKSKLLDRFTRRYQYLFEPARNQTYMKSHTCMYSVNGEKKRVKLNIWNISTLYPKYLRGTAGIVLVYDDTHRESFESIIQTHAAYVYNHAWPDTVLTVVAVHDSESEDKVIPSHMGQRLAEEIGRRTKLTTGFFEVSSSRSDRSLGDGGSDASNASRPFDFIVHRVLMNPRANQQCTARTNKQ